MSQIKFLLILMIIFSTVFQNTVLTVFAQTSTEPTTTEPFDILKKAQTYIEEKLQEKQKEIEEGIKKEIQEEVEHVWQRAIDRAKEGIKNKVKQLIENIKTFLINFLKEIKSVILREP